MKPSRNPTLRPATKKDIEEFYPGVTNTFRAIVAELDGRILGVGGVFYAQNNIVAFSSFKPEMDEFPITKIKGFLKGKEFIKGLSCMAEADEKIPLAPKLLERLGFKQVQGRVYQWVT